MIRLVTYADDSMSQSMNLCVESALKNGVDICWPQNPNTIDPTFREFNKEILEAKRGAGFWLWKPYHIYKAMLGCQEGDILIWSDAGQEFVGDVKQVIKCMKENVMLFNNGFAHVEWCKMDVINRILPICPGDNTIGSKQPQASFQIYYINEASKKFVKEWLLYCQMPGMIDDFPSIIPNVPNFADHRHDQAILGCLRIKYKIPLHWFPSLTNMHRLDMKLPGDDYPAIINHHRKRNRGFGNSNNPEW
jgi:hypothetical protein